jgi:glucosamine-6-phosphate deaminase
MKLKIFENANELGAAAARQAAEVLRKTINENGSARLLLSTGASQFTFFESFVKEDVDWSKVEMFHLDEYVGMSPEHPASFQKYLRERFVSKVNLGKYHLINGEDKPEDIIAYLTKAMGDRRVDLGLIGIGENGHIAFNDPPADFDDKNFYKVVDLNPACIRQQIREGWFKDENEAFKQAISMTCSKIMDCKTIISVVPYSVKAQAVRDTLTLEETVNVPATLMKRHSDVTLYCDKESIALTDPSVTKKFV